jgi:hypothetical protein
MPWGVAAGVVGSVAGAAVSSALAPGTSGGSGGGQSYYVPTGLTTADQQWQNLQNQNYNVFSGSQQQLQDYGQQSLAAQLAAYNTYGSPYQQAANQAGQQYGNLGSQLTNAAGLQFGQQQGLLNAGQQVYNTAFDPQNALYNRTVQQLQDQTGATNSMYGLGSSAAGAGVANQALGNFNIDWQNQQLQRQLQGLQGYGSAVGQAGQTAAQGGALGSAGAGYTLQGGQLPYQTAQTLGGAPAQIGTNYSQYLQGNVYGPAQGFQGQAIPYLNYGQGAQAVPYQNQLQGAGAAGALAGQGISQGISSIGNNPQFQNAVSNYFNPASGSFSGGDFSGAFTSSPYYSGGGNSYGFTM